MDYLKLHSSNPTGAQRAPDAPILDIRNLYTEFHTEYGVVKAVNGVSFVLTEGETLGIVGESGSGKTVTMLSVMQLIDSPPGRIAGGEVWFEGTNLLKLAGDKIRDIRGGKIAMVFQDPLTSLNPVFTIGEQLIEPLKAHLGLSGKSARDRARESLTQVGIPDPGQALDYYPHQFSGGMRQRTMIAMAISCNPSLLIADEPTTALDVTVQEQILQLIENLRQNLGMSIVWITHDLGVIAGLADRVIVMYAGEIVECSSTCVLFEDPRHPYTQGLLQSIPRVDIPKSEKLKPILGNPPDLIHLRMGCHFAPRCQYRITKCLSEHPELVEVGPDHTSRCWVQPVSPVRFS
jgi:oligopeptide transport system ATP-binding protein